MTGTGTFEHFLEVTRAQEERDRGAFVGVAPKKAPGITEPFFVIGTTHRPETTWGAPGPGWKTCQRCEGKRRVDSFVGSMMCPACGGRGTEEATFTEVMDAVGASMAAWMPGFVDSVRVVADNIVKTWRFTVEPVLKQFAATMGLTYAEYTQPSPLRRRRPRSGPRRRR